MLSKVSYTTGTFIVFVRRLAPSVNLYPNELLHLFKLVHVSASLVKVVRTSRQGEVHCREVPPLFN